jgi:Xaa-Pro dipeptidase
MRRYASKIEALAAKRKAPGSFGDLGPGALATGEWTALGLELPDVPAIRAWRLARVRAQLAARDYAAILLADPINIRYATDSTNMQVWCLHNPVRYAFVATAGPVVVFDFHGSAHLSGHLDLVDEVRPGRAWYFFNSGPRVAEHAAAWPPRSPI